MAKVDNQQKGPSTGSRITNNVVALLAIIFIIVSAGTNYYILSLASHDVPRVTGRATGDVEFCINGPITGTHNCSVSITYGSPFTCFVNASDYEGEPILYSDNTTLFDINQSGWINFTSSLAQAGNHSILLQLDDGQGCSNSILNLTVNLVITTCIEPIWDEFKTNLSTNLSLLSCWDNISGLALGVPGSSRIVFSSISDINDYDLDAGIELTHASIFLNKTIVPNLNKWSDLAFYNLTMRQPLIFTSGSPCNASICTSPVSYNGNATLSGTASVTIANFNDHDRFYVLDSAYLNISDDTDNYIRYNTQNVTFYADYEYGNETDIVDGMCTWYINGPGATFLTEDMAYDTNTSSFTHTTIIRRPGTYLWNVTCNRTDYYTIRASDNVTITNRKPVLVYALPNETWPEDSLLTGRDLDDYFTDPDGDNLTYNYTLVANIDVNIDRARHIITLDPDKDFFGTRNVIYFATDPSNDSTPSNLVILTVQNVDEPIPEQGGGGGGGGGGMPRDRCEEFWVCQAWTDCLPSGYRSRSCIDLTECDTTIDRPSILENCTYSPTCFDNIKNGEETGVDCGGGCGTCFTCRDGIQNQGEEGVDCGGPCSLVCPTCFDGIQNGAETGIDCGGICSASCTSCSDGIQNGDEEGVDCGGSCADECGALAFLESPFSGRGFSFWMIIGLVLLPLLLFVSRRRLKQGFLWAEHQTQQYWRYLMTPKTRAPEELIDTLLDRLENLHDQIATLQPHDTIEQLVRLMREYVGMTIGIGYAFTFEELKLELEQHRMPSGLAQQILRFFKRVEKHRFSEEGLSQNELEGIIIQAKDLVAGLALQRAELSANVTKRKVTTLFRQASRDLRNGQVPAAKGSYKTLLHAYKSLEEEQKSIFFKQIKVLHGKITDLAAKQKENP